jgi:hypothetical protein
LVLKIRILYLHEAFCEAHLHKKIQKIQKFIALAGPCPNQPKPISELIVL